MNRNKLAEWIVEALKVNGGVGSILDVSKIIWEKHHLDLKDSGDMFYQWQYEMRWSARRLRKDGILEKATKSNRGSWKLK